MAARSRISRVLEQLAAEFVCSILGGGGGGVGLVWRESLEQVCCI